MTSWPELHAQARYRPRYPSEAVVRWLAGLPERGGLALDIGAGAGRHTKLLSEFGYTAVATDVSFEGLRHIQPPMQWYEAYEPWVRLTSGMTFPLPEARIATCAQADMCALPFGDGTFDAALAYACWYYGDPKWAAWEMYRVLKPGGHGFVTLRTPDDYAPSRGEAGMMFTLTPEGALKSLFAPLFEFTYERCDTTRNGRTELDSEWLISLTKR